MIYITGDAHMPTDGAKINNRNFPEQKTLTKADYVLLAGDLGIVWDDGKTDKYLRKELDARKFTTLFVDGNHENHALLNAYPVETWNGGKIHKVMPSVIHLMRGQVFAINGYKFFTMGGASSIDRFRRIEGHSWWPEEMPSQAEYEEGLDNLSAHNWKVDFVVTHAAPLDIVYMLFEDAYEGNDPLYSFFSILQKELDFKHWYFGHYHVDQKLNYKYTALFNKIIRIA